MFRVYPLPMKMPEFGGKKTNMRLMAALVVHDHETLLVDTGYAGQPDIFEQLAHIGYHPQDIRTVINTHVHPDHAGNNRAFTNARIVVSRIDYEFMRDVSNEMLGDGDPVEIFQRYYPEYHLHQAERHAHSARRTALRFWDDAGIGRLDRVQWIEDGPVLPPGMELWPTPGHTPGHHSVCLRGDMLDMLIAGDAMPSKLFWKRNLRETVPRFSSPDYEASKKRIQQFDGIIMGGHDLPFDSQTAHYVLDYPIIL